MLDCTSGYQLYQALGYWLVLSCAAGFLSMGIDKFRAAHNERRTPEKTLLIVAAVGGSFGTLLGGFAFHHKTSKLGFLLALAFLAILWSLVLETTGFLGCVASLL